MRFKYAVKGGPGLTGGSSAPLYAGAVGHFFCFRTARRYYIYLTTHCHLLSRLPYPEPG